MTYMWRRSLILGAAAVALPMTAALAEPAWPADFDEQLAARMAAAKAESSSSADADAATYDTWRMTSDDLTGLGTSLAPFESRSRTWDEAACEWLNTNPAMGLLLMIR